MLNECIYNQHNIIGLALILLLEAWLGKTEKTKYSSILELVFAGGILLVLTYFKLRRDSHGRN